MADGFEKVFKALRISVICVGLIVASPFIVAYALFTGRSLEIDLE